MAKLNSMDIPDFKNIIQNNTEKRHAWFPKIQHILTGEPPNAIYK